MTKFLYFAFAILLTAGVCACSNDGELLNPLELPQGAQEFLAQHFSGFDVKSVEKSGNNSNTEYKVVFTNGYEVEFDAIGGWTDVDAPDGRMIPEGIAPSIIEQYVYNYYPNDGINEISRDYQGYDVELVSGVNLLFSLDGTLIETD